MHACNQTFEKLNQDLYKWEYLPLCLKINFKKNKQIENRMRITIKEQ